MTWREQRQGGLRGLVGEVLTQQTAQNHGLGLVQGKTILWFIIVIIIDIISSNLSLEVDINGDLTERYWYKYDCWQSFSFMAYIFLSWVLSQKYSIALKVLTFNWLGFAISDFVQELLSRNTMFSSSYYFDWFMFLLFFGLTIFYYKLTIKNNLIKWMQQVKSYYKR
jgi:hypothetical protein